MGLSTKPWVHSLQASFFPGIYSSQNFNHNNLLAECSEAETGAEEEGLQRTEGQMASLLRNTNSQMNKTFE